MNVRFFVNSNSYERGNIVISRSYNKTAEFHSVLTEENYHAMKRELRRLEAEGWDIVDIITENPNVFVYLKRRTP